MEITMPQLGETVTEGTITNWLKAVGDTVAIDEPLFEVSTDKVDSEVPSPFEGVLTEIMAQEGDTVEVGQVVGKMSEGSASEAPAKSEAAPEPAAEPTAAEPAVAEQVSTPQPELESSPQENFSPISSSNNAQEEHQAGNSGKVTSPIVRKLIRENNLDESQVQGTGPGGKITKSDVEATLSGGRQSAPDVQPQATQAQAPQPQAAQLAPLATAPVESAPVAPPLSEPKAEAQPVDNAPAVAGSNAVDAMDGGDIIIPFDNIRRRTAQHVVMSHAVSAHVYTSVEVDFERIQKVREQAGPEWKAKEGFSLTYLPFVVRAVSEAVREFPHMNSSIKDECLVVHRDLHMSIAVDLNFQGLIAPVIRHADGKRVRLISREIKSLATRAKSKQLRPDEISGGTLTITNPGPFGTHLTLPIINQPQVAIISTDGIKKKPVVVSGPSGEDFIAVHHVGNIALTWDHRAFDGAYAAAFMNRVKQILETADWEKEVL